MSFKSFERFLKWKVGETKPEEEMRHIPRRLVNYIEKNRELSEEDKLRAKEIIRKWFVYAKENNFGKSTDLFLIRYHLAKFAEQNFSGSMPEENYLVESISNLESGGVNFEEEVCKFAKDFPKEEFKKDILHNEKVGFFGGTARLAAKMKLGLDINSELPINDLDLIVSDGEEAKRLSEKYGIDIAGIKILNSKSVKTELEKFISNVDCTMNQVGVCGGQVYVSERAAADLQTGTIRLVCKVDPLFGTEGVDLGEGKIYMNRKGFYRTLSFLIREKGKGVVLSSENINSEKDNIGDYWLSILLVKILPMKSKNPEKCEKFIRNWFSIAKKIGSTTATTPLAFLEELVEKDDENKISTMFKSEFGNFEQVKWLIGKLIGKSMDSLFNDNTFRPPETYTPLSLELGVDDDEGYDFTQFWGKIEGLKK